MVLLKLSAAIDRLTERVGKVMYWFVLAMVLVSSGNALMRYSLNISSNAWLELQWYMFSAVFLLCAAYTLQLNEHIRIDIIASRLQKRTRDWIDVLGHLFFLLPLCLLMLYESWPYFLDSFRSGEMSGNAGGLIRWPAKLFMVIGFALLLLQGISELIKRIAVLRGAIPDPHASTQSPSH
jgi:TRAP-type mannitol/chloroaromatic compound transport system permease small subunit